MGYKKDEKHTEFEPFFNSIPILFQIEGRLYYFPFFVL